MKIKSKLFEISKSVSNVLNYIGSLLIFVIMSGIFVDVMGRVLINKPLVGTTEIVQNFIPIIVFLMFPWCCFENSHIRSSMLLNIIKKQKIVSVLTTFAYFIGILLMAGIIYSTWGPMLYSTSIREFQGEMFRMPVYPVYWAIVIGTFFGLVNTINVFEKSFLNSIGYSQHKKSSYTKEDLNS